MNENNLPLLAGYDTENSESEESFFDVIEAVEIIKYSQLQGFRRDLSTLKTMLIQKIEGKHTSNQGFISECKDMFEGFYTDIQEKLAYLSQRNSAATQKHTENKPQTALAKYYMTPDEIVTPKMTFNPFFELRTQVKESQHAPKHDRKANKQLQKKYYVEKCQNSKKNEIIEMLMRAIQNLLQNQQQLRNKYQYYNYCHHNQIAPAKKPRNKLRAAVKVLLFINRLKRQAGRRAIALKKLGLESVRNPTMKFILAQAPPKSTLGNRYHHDISAVKEICMQMPAEPSFIKLVNHFTHYCRRSFTDRKRVEPRVSKLNSKATVKAFETVKTLPINEY